MTNNKSFEKKIVSMIMGSTSDWETMKNAADILTDFEVAHECKVVSAHRTPDLLFEFAKTAKIAALKSSSRARAARRICRECARRKQFCRFWAFPCKAKRCPDGFTALNRADARRNSRRNSCYRRSGREKCGTSGNCNFGEFETRTERKVKRISEQTNTNGFGF